MRKIHKKRVSTNSKFFKEELIFTKGWTKHHPTMDEPLDGMQANEGEVFGLSPGDITEAYYDYMRGKYVIKTYKTVWYELPKENLEMLREERRVKLNVGR